MNSLERTALTAANTLFLSSSMANSPSSTCFENLPDIAPEKLRLAFVAHSHSTDPVLEGCLDQLGSFPAALEIIDVGGMMRSTASQSGSKMLRPGVTIHTESPDDLTGLGITLSEFLAEASDETQTIICFDSLTTILQYSDLEPAYKFLHIITGRIHATDGLGFFHLDPSAHDSQTVEIMKSLFDEVIEGP